MGIEDLLAWYQKKIGTYDKQQWEKTIEQRIVHGLSNIQLKTTKPKTDLIDLDLVRGSSFTKAKPKHGFLTVLRLSVLRIVFLPVYSKWWTRQTSGRIFLGLLLLYLMQMFTVGIYSYHAKDLQAVPLSEFFVPMLMIWIVSFVHSQIVATNPGPDGEGESMQTTPFRKLRYIRRARTARSKSTKRQYHTSHDKNVLFKENDVIKPNVEGKINVCRNRRARIGHVDDDGFESLNGNGSSPSDNGDALLPEKSCSSRCESTATACTSRGARCDAWVDSLPPRRRLSAPNIQCTRDYDTDSDACTHIADYRAQLLAKFVNNEAVGERSKSRLESTCDTDEEGECETVGRQTEAHTSSNEWHPIGMTTTNSEECGSYSSRMSDDTDDDDDDVVDADAAAGGCDTDAPPNSILSPYCGPSNRVSCTIWERKEIKKADLSVVEISSVIIARVEAMPGSIDCFYMGLFVASIISALPVVCRFCDRAIIATSEGDELQVTFAQIAHLVFAKFGEPGAEIIDAFLGTKFWERIIMLTAAVQRFLLSFSLFFLLSVAERTFKQRFIYAKLFSHLTSSRRARKSDLPHFRLNKVRNIITWLSVRSYLKKRGPQRSVEVIVSAAFVATLLLLSILCMELLKDTFVLNSQFNLEILIWSAALGALILRFMILAVKINKKYRNLSVLITEQINLYLQIERKPNKKEELMVANSVLKLAADLLKELESQFKILGLSANPVLYNITKVVILSALSGVLSEILGFKLKLHKIKIK